MNDWPAGRDEQQPRYGRGSGSARPESARSLPHVRRRQAPPPAAPPRTTVPPQPQYGRPAGGPGRHEDGYNTGQVYGGGGGRGGGPQDGPGGPGGRRPAPDWGRRVKVGLITFLVAALVVSVGTYMWASSKLRGEVDLAKVIERPEEGEGTNYLIVGSDSRDGMTDDDKKRLHTGSAEGKRTDSMMILHVGSNGNTMVSLPRDSEVEIPSFKGSESGKLFPAQGRRVKLNAAYAEDGPELLVRTVEYNTGLRIDHYAEIGFGGFANIVDALGGVEMDIPKAFKDKKSGADFQAGEQTLDGQQALAFVRTRYAFAGSDLDRTKNQQKFLATLANQAATPSTVLNPFRLYPTLGAGLDTLVVDEDMGLFDLAGMFWAMKGLSGGEGTSMNMPISGSNGGNLVWDKAKKDQLMQQLRNDEKVTVTE
ncbi:MULTISPECIES: LCP family protein [Streptomyces]|uniref:Transcriptional regulator n=1 Tax=Streptomyces diastaticus subsp. diastaticus TaxID=68040 RepID=A0ABQ1CXJ5_STRDI|nr:MULTISPECIES: LCP family protein [Streptomyces]MDQ0293626.1 LCP family protein required for cell wall assembly [Streptomyces sp. DSM 41037]WSU36041.1 LCP family protein [Streptomyces gougerotii]GFH74989.1 transcriptional regulator [Streptomyces diastaticus subsp. diastaticus]GGU40336.1 transcriptional regulator [Streptomyces diastaticus subsp. diastaticus]